MPVAVLVTRMEEVPPLFRWSSHFARASQSQLVLIHPVAGGGGKQREWTPGQDAAGSAFFRALESALRENPERAEGLEVRALEQESENPAGAAIGTIRDLQVNLLIISRRPARQARREESIERQLFQKAPCATLQLRAAADSGARCRAIVVAAAGGPHAGRALRVARELADAIEARVTALYVEPRVGDEAEQVGARILDRILRRSLGSDADRVEARVVVADDVYQGIRSVPADGYDLLIVGASKLGVVRRVLFGTVPARLLSEPHGPSLAVIRDDIPLANRLRQRLDRWFQNRVPQLEREQRLALFERVQSNSRWNFDFITLICLSTLIATLGLIRNSAAVVIGAMLVAPLMTPLVGAGLALVQGNTYLVRNAARSVAGGFFLAFAIAFLTGLAVPAGSWLFAPGQPAPAEMLSRGTPGVLDLGVAFASGLAAAYAMGRPNLSSALPGVAIAAALVPPIATSGLALSLAEPAMALGAAVLFLTNIVAIVLGAACSLWAVGLRSGHEHGRAQSWVWRAVTVLLLVTAALVAALTWGPF